MTRHYLDHNATAPVRPEVIAAVTEAMQTMRNASSVHGEGRETLRQVEHARDAVARLVGAPTNGVIFTSGGTEAIHTAIHGVAARVSKIFVSALEHAAVSATAEATGLPVEIFAATPSGVVDIAAMHDRLASHDAECDGGFLVCLMAANNETGVLQPLREAAEIVHAAGGLLFVDAAQAVGKTPVNFVMAAADMMSLTGHKFGGPIGVGALIARPNLPLDPVFRGGGQEMNRRAGTTNAPAVIGLGKACELAQKSLEDAPRIAALRDKIEAAVRSDGARIWGADERRLPGTLCYSAPGFTAETQLMALDLAGVAVSSGSACSSGKVKPSHVLSSMGADDEEAKGAIRVSLGWSSTEADADAFISAWRAAYQRVKERAA